MEKEEEGKIVLGGCCVSEDDLSWQCIESHLSPSNTPARQIFAFSLFMT
jgi:hypothetical protein